MIPPSAALRIETVYTRLASAFLCRPPPIFQLRRRVPMIPWHRRVFEATWEVLYLNLDPFCGESDRLRFLFIFPSNDQKAESQNTETAQTRSHRCIVTTAQWHLAMEKRKSAYAPTRAEPINSSSLSSSVAEVFATNPRAWAKWTSCSSSNCEKSSRGLSA